MASYGVLEFTSKSRIQGQHGIVFTPLFSNNSKCVVQCHKSKTTNMWAKVNVTTGELVELLGEVGDPAVESAVLRAHFAVTPCKYPTIASSSVHLDKTRPHLLNAYTVDGPCTLDRDDALSYHEENGVFTIGIHICDVTYVITPELYAWAHQRGASAYWTEIQNGMETSKPMLPPPLAHEQLSLNADGPPKPCISLLLHYSMDTGELVGAEHGTYVVSIAANLTYDAFATSIEPSHVVLRNALRRVSGLASSDAEDLIAWAMLEYNKYFAKIISNIPRALLRVQGSRDEPAAYAEVRHCEANTLHATVGSTYGHFSSPIRRFADLHNQCLLRNRFEQQEAVQLNVDALNLRMKELQQFHYHSTVAMLAYTYKKNPCVTDAEICCTDDGRFLLLQHLNRRIRIPLYDSYYAEPIREELRQSPPGTRHRIEMFGILHRMGRVQLRVRFLQPKISHQLNVPTCNRVVAIEKETHVQDPEPMMMPQASTDDASPIEQRELDASLRLESLLGYALDAFQKKALRVMLEGHDLLGMAPTGSGKTVLALMAVVLHAFDKGGRAILTSPIKALSNQKYAEFKTWFKRIVPPEMGTRVTLLTGDIQARATLPGGDGKSELLIMTSEILANKLEQTRRSGMMDPDIVGVRVVIMDEVHYINDIERGHVWETSIMNMPSDIPIVALSATLSHPDRFCEWMSRRRPTRVVQRYDRHVPLHLGGYPRSIAQGFVELYSTHGSHQSLSSAAYEELYMKPTGRRRIEFDASIHQLVNLLEKDDKLPAIVFFMSRDKCLQAASCVSKSLLYGTRPKQTKDQDDYDFAYIMEEHQYKVQQIRNQQERMFRKYLAPYIRLLETLPGFQEFRDMLDKGVAYHHAGMLPILREFVELLFQKKLIKIVFATETLGVGINMPARTVVFAQVEKPCARGNLLQRRLLRPDEFWQMAGRSGRRGMDVKGYVVYYPIDGHPIAAPDFRQMLLGALPSVTSKLRIDKLFVLKHAAAEVGEAVLGKTLLKHELDRQRKDLQRLLDDMPTVLEEHVHDCMHYRKIQLQLSGKSDVSEVAFIKWTQGQRKKMEADMTAIVDKYGLETFKGVLEKVMIRKQLEDDLYNCQYALTEEWDESFAWLQDNKYIDSQGQLTLKGTITARLSDGEPLIRGALLEKYLALESTPLSFDLLASWMAGFSEPIRIRNPLDCLEGVPSELKTMYEDSVALANEIYDDDPENHIHWETSVMMHLWLTTRDIHRVCDFVDVSQLGLFVRMVLRICSFLDELKQILLGCSEFTLYNALENHHDKLLLGVVTNKSLYMD